MEEISSRNFADVRLRAAEAAAIELARKRTDQVLKAYSERHDTFGGRYVCADTMKELMPGFAESRETRTELNGAVHNAAAVLSSEQFHRLIEAGPKPGADRAVFVTGIPGAGKSTSVVTAITSDAGVVFEGQLSRPGPGMEKIDQALKAGFKIEIVAVHINPETALERTNFRFLDPNNGRGASIGVMSEIQGNLPDGLRQIHDRFGDRVNLSVLDNTPGKLSAQTGWQELPTLEKEGNREQIADRLHTALEAGYQSGKYTADFYAQAAGRRPAERVAGSDVREVENRSASAGNRPGIPSGDSKQNALSSYSQGKATTSTPKATPTLSPQAQPASPANTEKRGRGR